MTSSTVLALYSSLIILVSILGGWLPSRIKITHTGSQLMMSYVAGLMLGIAFYHLLPHAVFTLQEKGGIDRVVWWLMLGLLFMFALLRAFHFHQHGPVDEDDSQLDCSDVTHSHSLDHHSKPSTSSISWLGIALGLALHTLIDGLALAAAIQAQALESNILGLAGIGVFVAIVLHKPLDAMSISSLMITAGSSKRLRMIVNILFSLMCPLGALLFFIGIDYAGTDKNVVVGIALAFSAGVFICISLSDLLPEVQFHSHDRAKLTVALIIGVVSAFTIGLIEPKHGNDHTYDNIHEHRTE